MKTKLVERKAAEVTVSVEDLLALLGKACVDLKVAAGHEVIALSVEARADAWTRMVIYLERFMNCL